MKYLKLYNEWLEAGMMPGEGICASLDRINPSLLNKKPFNLINPTDQDYDTLTKNGKSELFWGSDSVKWETHNFTPLRQNLILLMACLNGEL